MKKTLGGDRLGAGKKLQVELHNYERSTHDLGYLWRSTMAAGTLVPYLSEIALPGDTWDINLQCEVMTHPTIGPLFGSYKVQLDVFQAPLRLYNSLLHNNALGIGMKMNTVKLPTITLTANPQEEIIQDLDNSQINPSSILSYIGIRGIGSNLTDSPKTRDFQITSIIAYWDIYKNYYANKMEENGVVIHTPSQIIIETVDDIEIYTPPSTTTPVPEGTGGNIPVILSSMIRINYTGTPPNPEQIIFKTQKHDQITAAQIAATNYTDTGTQLYSPYWGTNYGNDVIYGWNYATNEDISQGQPKLQPFALSNIDEMREKILSFSSKIVPFNINTDATDLAPYCYLYQQPNNIPNILSSQEGLGIKTYQSDLFNNWLNTEWIDGTEGISAITAIDTSEGSFTIDTLNLSKKVYDMLNRVAVSGGSYEDWLDAVYTHERYTKCESPIYHGGLIKELIFQEVISNSANEEQPLGTLAGRGRLSEKHKGGNIVIKVDEPSYIIGIISLTPRIDYSQGNKWDTRLQTMDDLHKPALDEIGFQELITEQMAWWDTQFNEGTSEWETKSAGKQPAWMNYMTNINRTYGNFAIKDNEMFMTLNRRYEANPQNEIQDLTTYIDPSKYNNIFAETQLDAQNFWVQIAANITARRKMSAKIMPNL